MHRQQPPHPYPHSKPSPQTSQKRGETISLDGLLYSVIAHGYYIIGDDRVFQVYASSLEASGAIHVYKGYASHTSHFFLLQFRILEYSCFFLRKIFCGTHPSHYWACFRRTKKEQRKMASAYNSRRRIIGSRMVTSYEQPRQSL